MNDLISRQAAIDELRDVIVKDVQFGDELTDGYNDGIDMAITVISKLKSAQRTGKWIIRDNPGTGWYRVTCSECGEDVTSTAPCIGFFPNAKVTWNYCPECGARMDAERKEE